MQPWGEQIRVKQSVKISIEEPVVDSEPVQEDIDRKVNLKFASIFTEEDTDSVEEECIKKKNNKMREKLK